MMLFVYVCDNCWLNDGGDKVVNSFMLILLITNEMLKNSKLSVIKTLKIKQNMKIKFEKTHSLIHKV